MFAAKPSVDSPLAARTFQQKQAYLFAKPTLEVRAMLVRQRPNRGAERCKIRLDVSLMSPDYAFNIPARQLAAME